MASPGAAIALLLWATSGGHAFDVVVGALAAGGVFAAGCALGGLIPRLMGVR